MFIPAKSIIQKMTAYLCRTILPSNYSLPHHPHLFQESQHLPVCLHHPAHTQIIQCAQPVSLPEQWKSPISCILAWIVLFSSLSLTPLTENSLIPQQKYLDVVKVVMQNFNYLPFFPLPPLFLSILAFLYTGDWCALSVFSYFEPCLLC